MNENITTLEIYCDDFENNAVRSQSVERLCRPGIRSQDLFVQMYGRKPLDQRAPCVWDEGEGNAFFLSYLESIIII